ncbi:MAG: hypothetical protein AAB770_00630 [Patescibacteria group bacterium]
MPAPQFGIARKKKDKDTISTIATVVVVKHTEIPTHRKVDMFLQLAADGKDFPSLHVFAEANGIGHVGVVKQKLYDTQKKEKEKYKKEKRVRHEQNLAMRAATQSASAKKHDSGKKKN